MCTPNQKSPTRVSVQMTRQMNRLGKLHQRPQKGVTLVEMLVVIFILGLVGAIAFQNLAPEQQRAIKRKTQTDVRIIETALEQYNLDMLNYPTTSQGLEALLTVPADVQRKDNYRPGGYLRTLPSDPWGRPYQYRYPGERTEFEVFSLGADGEPGGEGKNADIGNWQSR